VPHVSPVDAGCNDNDEKDCLKILHSSAATPQCQRLPEVELHITFILSLYVFSPMKHRGESWLPGLDERNKNFFFLSTLLFRSSLVAASASPSYFSQPQKFRIGRSDQVFHLTSSEDPPGLNVSTSVLLNFRSLTANMPRRYVCSCVTPSSRHWVRVNSFGSVCFYPIPLQPLWSWKSSSRCCTMSFCTPRYWRA